MINKVLLILMNILKSKYINIGDWGLGIEDWRLEIGDWGQDSITKAQTTIR